MSLPIVFRPEATQDVEEVCRFLNNEHAGLGDKFVLQLNDRLQKAASHPRLFAAVWQNVRATVLKRFTYVAYYRAHADRIEVLAVVHGNRDDSSWKSRA